VREVAGLLAEWVTDDETRRDGELSKLLEAIALLASEWDESEAQVLWRLWNRGRGAVTVYPKVSKIVRLVEGRHERRDA